MRDTNDLQGTGAWFNQRIGKLTASRMAAAINFLKTGKESSARRDLKIEILSERLTDQIMVKYTTADMQWGIEQEPAAKEAFEKKTGLTITDVGFIDHPIIEYFGCSPDGFVSDGNMIEVKCPKTTTHLGYLLDNVVPEQYKPQMLVQAACTGKNVWFCSFDPRLPEKQQLFIKLYEPTPAEVSQIESHAEQFLFEVEELFTRITEEV